MSRTSWLYPFTYGVHLVEEYVFAGGFPAWARQVMGLHVSNSEFVAWNAFAMTLTSIGAFLVNRNERQFAFVDIALASSVLANALMHLVASAATGTYSPGVMTGVIIWGPFGTVRLQTAFRAASRRAAWVGAGMGILTVVVTLAVLIL